MSIIYYTQQWFKVMQELVELLKKDKAVQEGGMLHLLTDKNLAIDRVTDLYYRYRRMAKQLITCQNEVYHPQVQDMIGQVLDSVLIRMLEYRQQVVILTMLEYPTPLESLIKMKCTPEEVELRAPLCRSAARQRELDHRRQVAEEALHSKLQESLSKESDKDSEEGSSLEEYKVSKSATGSDASVGGSDFDSDGGPSLSGRGSSTGSRSAEAEDVVSPEEAERRAAKILADQMLVTIQRHERWRVGIKEAKIAWLRNERMRLGSSGSQEERPRERWAAAVSIQRIWRGYRARKHFRRLLSRLDKTLGLTIPNWRPRGPRLLAQEYERSRREAQRQHQERFAEASREERRKMWEVSGPRLLEDTQDEIAEWYLMWYRTTRLFDPYPRPEEGGTVLLALGLLRTPEELADALKQAAAEAAAAAAAADIEELPKAKQRAVLEEPPDPDLWQMPPSAGLPLLSEALRDFQQMWEPRKPDQLAADCRPIPELFRDAMGLEMQLQMRRLADDRMRQWVTDLDCARVLDFKGNPDNEGEPMSLEPDVYEELPEWAREAPPVPPHADPQELFTELTRQGVIRETPRCDLADWPGVASYEVRRDPILRLGDLLQPLLDYCVLPLLSEAVHRNAPLIRSVCLVGPPGCGQDFLAQALCAELKATVIDLSPSRHKGKFRSKKSQMRLVANILQLARAYAPTVVFVEGGELPWVRKLPSNLSKYNPRRFGPLYQKIIKEIQPGDQILFLSTATMPQLAGRQFPRVYDKMVVVPPADLATLFLGLKRRLMRFRHVDRHVNLSAAARLMASECPVEPVLRAVDAHMNTERRLSLSRRPLEPEELFGLLYPVRLEEKELGRLQAWRSKQPLEARRLAILQAEEEARKVAEQAKKKK